MHKRFTILIRFILLAFCFSPCILNAQVLRDTASLSQIKKDVDFVYNFQFDKADDIYNNLNRTNTGHSVLYLLRGMVTYWKNYPLTPSSPAHTSFEKDLHTSIQLSEAEHKPENEAEYLLLNLCARGLLLDYYANNDLSMEVIPLAKETYHNIRLAFNYTNVFTDFYFFTGLYNYYREAYPDEHRFYRALAFLFPKGNKVRGYKEIQLAANNSIFLKAEASSLLSWINMSFENNYAGAFDYSNSLRELYPANIEYLGEYIKNLMLIKKYNEAETLIISTGNEIGNTYYQAQLTIFNGILQEKKYRDYKKAEEYYNKGIDDISVFGAYGNEFGAYAYFGLSRVGKDKSDKHNKKAYRKKANDLATYKKVNFDD